MPIEKLTDARLRGLKHADGEIVDAKSGLSARADKAGKVTISIRYRFGTARPRIFLGYFPQLALVDARIEAGKVKEAVRKGRDPQADRRDNTISAQTSFNDLADIYVERYAKTSKASWKTDARLLAFNVRPHWGKKAAASITKADLTKLLFGVAGRAPVQANRVRAVLGKLFSWSVDNGLLEINPCLGVKKPTKEKGKTRALDDREIAVLWRAFDTARSVRAEVVAALKTLVLLGQRPGEVAGMLIGELHQLDDGQNAYWQIPASRMKARRAHIVPMVGLAREIVLAELARPHRSEQVFAGPAAKLGSNALSTTLARIIDGLDDAEGASLKADKPTPHDFRRSAISGMARLGVPRDTRMAIAAHSHGDTHSVYDQHDYLAEKRSGLERWERHVRKIIAGKSTGGAEIVALRREVAP